MTGKEAGLERAIVGCILGTAVGDAMGLACEGLGRRRQARMFPDLDRYRMLGRRGFTSDDTEHTCMLAQSLIVAGAGEPEAVAARVARSLGWRLRLWVMMLPAGIGLATLRATLKLWLGFPARASGVRSAGNGPAMRIALVGVCYADDPERQRSLARAVTRITHTHPDALDGALAIAVAARLAAAREDVDAAAYLEALGEMVDRSSPMYTLIRDACASVERGEDAGDHARALGCERGVSGWIRHTVPMVIHVWLRHQADYRGGVTEMIRLGGDSDTTAAILGAILGARVGRDGIPASWLRDLAEWPRTVSWMERLGARLATCVESGEAGRTLALNLPGLMLRNVLFIVLVLGHGVRRLLPPY